MEYVKLFITVLCLFIGISHSPKIIAKSAFGRLEAPEAFLWATGWTGFITLQWLI